MATSAARRVHTTPRAAARLADALRAAQRPTGAVSMTIDDASFDLPADLVAVLLDLLEDVSEGKVVTSAPASLPIGTELAADLLGVSRPWLTTLLDRGAIPSTRTGTKRRVRLGDVLAYRRADDSRRRAALNWEFLDEEPAQPSS